MAEITPASDRHDTFVAQRSLRPFSKLMDLLEAELRKPDGKTLGGLAEKYSESPDRIIDAIDAVKERCGQKSYIDV